MLQGRSDKGGIASRSSFAKDILKLIPKVIMGIRLLNLTAGPRRSKVQKHAEVFRPWVRWEGPGCGLESLSTSAGGVWKSKILMLLGFRPKNMVIKHLAV